MLSKYYKYVSISTNLVFYVNTIVCVAHSPVDILRAVIFQIDGNKCHSCFVLCYFYAQFINEPYHFDGIINLSQHNNKYEKNNIKKNNKIEAMLSSCITIHQIIYNIFGFYSFY